MISRSALSTWFLGFYAVGAATAVLVVVLAAVLSLLRRITLNTRQAAQWLQQARASSAALGRIEEIAEQSEAMARPRRRRER